jgi:hypothetical protein
MVGSCQIRGAATWQTPTIAPDLRLGFTFDRDDRTPWSDAVIYRYDLR